MPPRLHKSRLLICLVVLLSVSHLRADDPFQDKVVPFLKTYCVQCHNKKNASGELDLTRFTSSSMLIEEFRQWEHVVTFLKKEEMPPKKAKQPTAAERAEILKTLDAVLISEARKLAGDPGVVLPRRLTNAEYDNTIADLTGVDIRPTAAFPLDPASGEGFNNTGEALTMSPALLKKYYSAAQHIADHALLTTTGLKFAPHPVVTFADRQKLLEQAILRFYDQHKVEYESYLTALWTYKHRPATQQSLTLDAWARERNLSATYLRSLWDAFEGTSSDAFYFAALREKWRAIPAKKSAEAGPSGEVTSAIRALANVIRQTSTRLCVTETQAIVSNAGNGPIEHLERRRRTAATRDAFNANAFARQRYLLECQGVAAKPTFKIVIQVGEYAGLKADGHVILDAGFSLQGNPANVSFADFKKKGVTLRVLLAEHDPVQLKKLTFGVHPQGKPIDPDSLVIKAPATIEIDMPAKFFNAKGNVNLFADARLEGSTHGMADLQLLNSTKANSKQSHLPLVELGHAGAKKLQESGQAFCRLFPNRFYYVDDTRGLSAGFHLIEGFFRDDQPLYKLVLSDVEKKQIDGMWNELLFGTDIWHKMLRGFVFFERSERNFLKHPDFDSIKEEDPELIKDGPLLKFKEIYLRRSNVKATGEELAKHPIDIFFEDIRHGLRYRSETLKKNEAIYLENIEAFAQRAFRRALTDAELQKLRKFYHDVCRSPELGVEQAVQSSIIRVLMSPHFCYRLDVAPEGKSVAPLSDIALASRLSYFLWASMPDDELFAVARAGKLRDPKVLRMQTNRMLKDPRVNRFALEFFGQWFGYREFVKQEAVNRDTFKTFDDGLRQAMFEEPTRLASHLIQQNEPITGLLGSDTTFMNKKLADHYGFNLAGKGDWELVNGLHKQGRSGVLGMAVFLTKNSQPQRTSPVKRGFWVVHKLLGEHIPAPPADVATLPAKETDTKGKTIRELLTLHTDDNRCARCHVRFDPVGLAMEGFDPIGRTRTKDLAGRAIDNLVKLPSGKEARGVPEFAQYLVAERKKDFNKTLCQKLLGYALGRSLQLSDHALLEKMQADLEANGDRLALLFETVVTSPQFLNQRCRDFSLTQYTNEAKGNR